MVLLSRKVLCLKRCKCLCCRTDSGFPGFWAQVVGSPGWEDPWVLQGSVSADWAQTVEIDPSSSPPQVVKKDSLIYFLAASHQGAWDNNNKSGLQSADI